MLKITAKLQLSDHPRERAIRLLSSYWVSGNARSLGIKGLTNVSQWKWYQTNSIKPPKWVQFFITNERCRNCIKNRMSKKKMATLLSGRIPQNCKDLDLKHDSVRAIAELISSQIVT